MPLLPGFSTLSISRVKGCLSRFAVILDPRAVMGQVGVLVVGHSDNSVYQDLGIVFLFNTILSTSNLNSLA
jgi:hypothetical protein